MPDEQIPKPAVRERGDRRNADILAESLREQQKRFDLAERIAHTGSLEWYTKTARMIWSDELFRILGFGPGSFVPTYKNFTASIHPLDAKEVLGGIRKSFADHTPYEAEFRIVRPDKTVRDVRMLGEVFSGAKGQPLKMNGSVQDITEHRLIEKRLALQYEELLKFTAAVDGMDDLVIMTDNAGTIEYVNRACAKDLGYPPEEMKGRHISEFRDPGSPFELRKEDFIDDPKGTWTGNLDLVNRYGMIVRTSLKSTPILDDLRSLCRVFVLRVQI